MGTVIKFCFSNEITTSKITEIPIVLVKFDIPTNYSITTDNNENIIPIYPRRTQLCEGYARYQLPLKVAHAQTIHSAQGRTAVGDVVLYPTDLTKPPFKDFTDALTYVGLSRATSLDGLYLVRPVERNHFNHDSYKFNKNLINSEYERLRKL